MSARIVFLPGDGIGPEVAAAARACLEKAARISGQDLSIGEYAFGGAGIDRFGDPLPDDTREACLVADAIFLGAVGGPQWHGHSLRPEQGLLELRKVLGVFANLRPVQIFDGMEKLSPLAGDRAHKVDLLIVRELTGGLYFGDRVEGTEQASDTCTYARDEITRVARVAFEAARKRSGKLTSVDKANVLATSRLWRTVATELQEQEFSDITLVHELVDAMAMKLIQAPSQFDVILTENLFGDILSDEASVISGSIGLAPSASLGATYVGLYEPIHGSAPDIAGQDKANPVGAVLSAAMLLRHSLHNPDGATSIEAAVMKALAAGWGTADIGGSDTCSGLTQKICDLI